MIDMNNLKFGDTLYILGFFDAGSHNNRVEMTDSNGLIWYRDVEKVEYEIDEVQYVGKVVSTIEGEINEYDMEMLKNTLYYFKYSDGSIMDVPPDVKNWFATKEEAAEMGKIQMRIKGNEVK